MFFSGADPKLVCLLSQIWNTGADAMNAEIHSYDKIAYKTRLR